MEITWRKEHHPRKWQSEALTKWVANKRRGIVKVVTGGGKTFFAQMCIKEFFAANPNGSVLIVVPSTALLDQWFVGLIEDFKIREDEISLFSAADKSDSVKSINIGIINSVRNLPRGTFTSPLLLILDECHRIASEKNQKILDIQFSCSLGLSATPERQYDGGFENVLIPVIGTVVFEYDLKQALLDGVICKFQAINIQVEFSEEEKNEFDALTKQSMIALRNYEKSGAGGERLKLILLKRARVCSNAAVRIPFAVKVAEQHSTERVIIFHESTRSADIIHSILGKRGLSSTIYHSKIPPFIRRDNLRNFKRGISNILVCCRSLDEGINVPEASVGIIASGTASKRQRTQRLGRILRPSQGKDVASIYTLYITKNEKTQLETEQEDLATITNVTWMQGSSGTV